MASEETYITMQVYPYPLTNLTVTAGTNVTIIDGPTVTAASDHYTVTLSCYVNIGSTIIVSADGYESQEVDAYSNLTPTVTLVAETTPLPEIEHIQLGGQTYALRDDRVDEMPTEIITKMFPNWSAGIPVSLPYTAPANGWLFLSGTIGDSNVTVYVTINDSPVPLHIIGYSGDWAGTLFEVTVPLAAGDKISVSSSLNGAYVTFYPCRG